jgi:hypothetical protein
VVKRDRGKRKWCRGLGLASEIQYLRDGLNILQCEWIVPGHGEDDHWKLRMCEMSECCCIR